MHFDRFVSNTHYVNANTTVVPTVPRDCTMSSCDCIMWWSITTMWGIIEIFFYDKNHKYIQLEARLNYQGGHWWPFKLPFVFSKWSTRRPGVAITTWGFLANANCWLIISIPPVMQAHDNPILEPSAWNCSLIWNANSRVGVRTKTDNRLSPGSLRSVWRTFIEF